MRFKSDDLQKGDIIVVPYSNYLHPAIFAEWGQRNNPQFYLLSESRLKYHHDNPGRRVYKNYIVRDKYTSVVKIQPEVLSPAQSDLLKEWMKFLTEKGLI